MILGALRSVIDAPDLDKQVNALRKVRQAQLTIDFHSLIVVFYSVFHCWTTAFLLPLIPLIGPRPLTQLHTGSSPFL